MVKIVFIILSLALTLCAQQPALTARELFYQPAPAAAAVTVTPAKVEPTQIAAKKQTPKKASPSKTATPSKTDEQPVVHQARKKNVPDAGKALPGGAELSNAAAQPERPLGLRYSLLKHMGGSRYDEVDPDTVFRAGDKIRVNVQANDSGYLYIVQRGSSGAWGVMFPSPEIESGNNHVASQRPYDLPPGGRFTFDEQAGEEKLFIILSRRPEADLEKLIYDLSSGPRKPETESQPKYTVLASNRIDDSVVGRIRNTVLSRDLVFEKVDESTAGDRKEKAMYVVNTARRDGDARLVVDLTLKHQ